MEKKKNKDIIAYGVRRIIIKGLKGDRGPEGKEGKEGKASTAIGPQGLPGAQGLPGKPGKDGAAGRDGKDGKPGKDGKITARGGGDIVMIKDLSALTDGSTLTFPVPYHRKAIMVIGSDFPSVLFENNGFTDSPTEITLTVSNAPSLGSQLGFQYVI